MKKYFDKLKKRIDESTMLDQVLIGSGKVLDVADRAADILVHIGPEMTAMGGVALASRVVSSMRDSRLISAVEYFESHDWVPLNLFGFESQAWGHLHGLEAANVLPIPSTYADEQAYIIDGVGPDLGFAMSGGQPGVQNHRKLKAESCWVRTEEERQKALEVLGRGLWENIGSRKALLVKDGNGIAVIRDDEEETFPSRKGDEVYEKLKLYLDKGHSRSVFMIGEAGVGKSHMLRYIAQKMGGLSLRVKIADLDEIPTTKMVKTIELLRPDSFIIDDFDRFVLGSRYADEGGRGSANAGKMLDPLQQINRMVKLFMVSANYSDSINDAVLRPGRFDELVEVHELDPELYEKMLPDAPAKLIKALKKEAPPIAYIAELKKRVEVLGYEEAAKEMEDLIRRSGRILELNKKKTARRKTRRKTASLVGKTKLKQAVMMEERATRADKAALRAKEDAVKAEAKAQEWREKAKAKREEAEEDKAKAEKKKAAKKKSGKKKPKKKAKAKKVRPPDARSDGDASATEVVNAEPKPEMMDRPSQPDWHRNLVRDVRASSSISRKKPKRKTTRKVVKIKS